MIILRCNYCGYETRKSLLFVVKLLFSDKGYVVCDNCNRVSSYQLVYHIVHDTLDKKEKEFNRKFEENKRKLWENG